jgi:hypothetical protein
MMCMHQNKITFMNWDKIFMSRDKIILGKKGRLKENYYLIDRNNIILKNSSNLLI